MRYVIDRIEGALAVCAGEDGSRCALPLEELYESPREGDHFVRENGVCLYDPEATEQARRRNLLLQRRLFEEY